MKYLHLKKIIVVHLFVIFCFGSASAQINERNVRAHMNFLAGDALQGRGSGTTFEWIAGEYFVSMMEQFGIEPAGETDSFGSKTHIQTINIARNTFSEAPKMSFSAQGSTTVFEHGKEMLVFRIASALITGEFQTIAFDEKPNPGAVAYVKLRAGDDPAKVSQSIGSLMGSGAAAVLLEETPQWRAQWANTAARKISFSKVSGSSESSTALIVVSSDAAKILREISDGTKIEIKGELAAPEIRKTWNAVGKIDGSDPQLKSEVVLLSAHMDHLGVRENAPGDDKIFNGADDDASGCVAVLEIARALASGKRPKRTTYFAFFGSEEAGGFGSRYFVNNLPFPKEKLVANLQFEMLGRPDPMVGADELWLTGYERSDLGVTLAGRGAKLVNDPHPTENFFQRSDNYTLARQGIIAHTVSSYNLHKDYHRASDEIKTIDFGHLTRSINSMVKPIDWLLNSNFKPAWYEGKKP